MKKYRIFSAALIIAFLLGLCACNTQSSQVSKFIGSYHSIYSDSQTDDQSISFTLDIENDNTFTLTKNGYRFTGTWKSSTKDNHAELICVMEKGYQANSYHPKAWTPYFVLSFLDDGTLMAVPATTSGSGVVSAFGYGEISIITMVYFEKD